jgi:hypothetical protein
MSAVLFGSISTLADTSELQRRAFNEAFVASGLDWNWSRDDYTAMLDSNGGAERIGLSVLAPLARRLDNVQPIGCMFER